ncbi:MAG: IS110 family transposase [candidate division NC10 bacterium]|nr:IS110 family transposase [candidate division NC10 bacterium]
MTRTFGLDISKHFAEVVLLQPGSEPVRRFRFPAEPAAIRTFASRLGPGDRVALESCTNAVAFHRLLCQHAGEVVVSNPLKTRIIAEAKVKTDKVDAEILARLLAADFLPPVWVPDPRTETLRHLVFHRHGLVQQRTQAKNRIHAILHRNLITPKVTDLFGRRGRGFLGRVELPSAERTLLEADLRLIDFLDGEVTAAERDLARAAHQDAQILRLLTIPGIAFTSAVALVAAIGDVRRFRTPPHLVSYFGLNPSVYQTGQKAYTGHISRRGRSHARSVCVEVAHVLVKAPGPFQAFFTRLRRRKPYNVAITAVARKLIVLVWHMLTKQENYRYAPPARTREKLARVRHLATGQRARRGELPGPVPDPRRDAEAGVRAQGAYEDFILSRFGPHGPKGIEHPNRHETSTPEKKTGRGRKGA